MLILISLTYCAIIWLVFIKLKLLPWNKKSQGAAVVVGVVLIVGIVILFGQGAPQSSGGFTIMSQVVQVSSRVQGLVTKVHAEPLALMNRGDPIFTVDPTPYEYEVKRLEAALEQAKAGVEQMKDALEAATADVANVKAQMKVLEANVASAAASVRATGMNVAAARESHEAAKAEAEKARLNVEIQRREYDRIEELVQKKVESESRLDSQRRRLNSDEASHQKAMAMERQARDNVAGVEATLESVKASAEATRRQQETLDAQLAKAGAAEQQARTALAPEIDGVHVSIRQVEEQLNTARFNLEATVVRAPADGYIAAMALREGHYVRMMPVLTYVSTERLIGVALFQQNVLQYIEKGQPAEVILASHPGRVFDAEVVEVAWAAGEAQIGVSGTLPNMNQVQVARQLVVRLAFKEVPEGVKLHVAQTGAAAIYTDFAKPVHIIRKIVIRMQSILNWIP